MAKKKKTAVADLDKLNETGRRKEDIALPEGMSDRRKTKRRRQIDPTTCERDYTNDEIEFMQAMDEYKRKSGRMFPTCSEILEVLRGMGYVRLDVPQLTEQNTDETDDIDSNTSSSVRTSDMIAEDFDEMESDFEEDDDLEDDFDDE